MRDTLSDLWSDFVSGGAKGSSRDLAVAAEMAEAQFVATGVGNGVTRLDVDWVAALPRLAALGEVKILTRNDAMVHGKVGAFGNCSVTQAIGLVLNGDVDLRIFLSHWHHTFLVETHAGPAIQVFDPYGAGVHAIHRTEATDSAAWHAFVTAHRAADQSPSLEILPRAAAPVMRPDRDVDVEALRLHWSRLKDVHHFHGMLADFGVHRLQAMRLVGAPWALPAPADVLPRFLAQVSAARMPFMVFVGNPGCIQIHTGTVDDVVASGDGIDVHGPRFTLHADTLAIADAWVVRKPSRESAITTLELFDARGENCAILSGQRDPGAAERPEWRALLAGLTQG